MARAAGRLSQTGTQASCGISVSLGAGSTETLACSDDLPVRFDWLQHELLQGPHAAGGQSASVVSGDLATDARWPEFGPLCASVLGVRRYLSVPVALAGGQAAVMNWLSDTPDAFQPEHQLLASGIAAEAAACGRLAVDRATLDGTAGTESQLARALGMVMARYRLQPADAFFVLNKASRDLELSMVEVAVEVVRSGRLPVRRAGDAHSAHGVHSLPAA